MGMPHGNVSSAVWMVDAQTGGRRQSGAIHHGLRRGWLVARPLHRLGVEFEAEQARWFLWLPVLFGLGIGLYFAAPVEPLTAVLAPLAAISLIAHLLCRRRAILRVFTAIGLAISLGALAAKLRTDFVAAPILERQLTAVDIRGFVELVEPRAKGGQRLTLRVVAFGQLGAHEQPRRVRIRTMVEDPSLKPGDGVRVRATVAPPPQPSTPGDFDFGRLAWFSALGGIGIATGTVERVDTLGDIPRTLVMRAAIERLRQTIRRRIVAALPGETGEIATALLTGERGGITEATNQAYRDSGLFHILSISGLHMVIMAGAVFWILRLGLAASPAIALRYPIKKWAAIGAIAGGFGYLLISGGAPATVRAWIMLTVMFLAVLLDRPALALRNIALAALVILALYPESLLDAGFQMSFAAVTGLISAYEYARLRREAEGRRTAGERYGPLAQALRFVRDNFVTTIIASLVVAPFGVYHFHNTQLLALVANVFAIPICNVIVMPAALGVLIALPFGLEVLPLTVMGLGIDAMTGVARTVGALPGAVVKIPAIPTASFALMIGGGLWLLLWARPWRLLGLIAIAGGVMLSPFEKRPDLYIGRDGVTVAVRGADGRLSALASRGSAFEVARWLDRDGDRRTPAEVSDAKAFTCDRIGCVARLKGHVIAVATTPATLRDDCKVADVLILRFVLPQPCGTEAKPRQITITPVHLTRAGAHALTVVDGTFSLETVAERRGRRPWSGALVPRDGDDVEVQPTGRLASFTSLFERFRDVRPEIDDDTWPRNPSGRLPPDEVP
jgi:competence protein ComEC